MSLKKYLKGVGVMLGVIAGVAFIGYLSTISFWLVLILYYLVIVYVCVEKFG